MDEIPSPRKKVFEGIGVSLALLFAVLFLSYAAFDTWSDWGPDGPIDEWTNVPMLLLSYFGLTQWVYLLPCYFFFTKKKMTYIARGLLIGGALILVGNLLLFCFFWWWSRK